MNRCSIAVFVLFFSILAGIEATPILGQVVVIDGAKDAETIRGLEQVRRADVEVYYDTAKKLVIQQGSDKDRAFSSESELLAYVAKQKKKDLLVVVLSKRHEFTNPKQTIDGFWADCKKTGFKQVVIQQAHSSKRPILRE